MAYDTARQQHIEWLQQQVEDKRAALAEAQARVSQLQADIKYYELMLNIHQKANADALGQDASLISNSNVNSNGVSQKSKQNKYFSTDDNLNNGAGNNNKRSPKEMLRAEFTNKTLAEVAEIVLNSRNEALSADDIAQVVFLTEDDDEYMRARNSLSTELRRGAKEGKWQQIGRGSFASSQFAEDLTDESLVHEHFSNDGSQ